MPTTYFESVLELTRGQLLDLALAVEERLRRLTRSTFRAHQPEWEQLIPKSIRTGLQISGTPGGDLLDRTTLGQLIEIVLARWEMFDDAIPLTREQFRVKANDFRAWRNRLAHGHAPSADEKMEIAVIVRQIGERIPVVDDEANNLGRGTTAFGAAVLWVDDYPESTLPLRQILTAFGIDVLPALSNDEAIEIANVRSVDLVISDIERGTAESGLKLPARLRALGIRAPILYYVFLVESDRLPPEGSEAITNDPAILIRDALALLTRKGGSP
jgi:CheY-like chemotaxis protein